MAIIVERIMAQDIELGTSTTSKTHPGGGTLNGHQVSLSTLSTVGASGSADTETWNPGEIATKSSSTTTVTVSGAALGDFVLCSFSLALSGLMLNGYVSAANTVTVVLFNPTGASVDLASGTVKVLVFSTR